MSGCCFCSLPQYLDLHCKGEHLGIHEGAKEAGEAGGPKTPQDPARSHTQGCACLRALCGTMKAEVAALPSDSSCTRGWNRQWRHALAAAAAATAECSQHNEVLPLLPCMASTRMAHTSGAAHTHTH